MISIAEEAANELRQAAEDLAYHIHKRQQFVQRVIEVRDKYDIPDMIVRDFLIESFTKVGLSKPAAIRYLPSELKQKQSPSPTRQETRRINQENNITSERSDGPKNDTNKETEQSEVTQVETIKQPDPEIREAVAVPVPVPKEEEKPTPEMKKYEHEMTELCAKIEILTSDNRELKKALADRTAFQAASQITPNEALVNRAKSAEQQVRDLTEELEALKQQKTLQLGPQPLELEMDTFWDTLVILFLPKNRGKTLKVIHDGSKVQQVMLWKSDKVGVKNSN